MRYRTLQLRNMHTVFFAVGLSAAACAVMTSRAGAQGAARPDSVLATPAAINAGRAIFHGQGTCLICHGSNLEGGVGPQLLRPHEWKDAKAGTIAAIVGVISNGVEGTAMASHPGGISDEQVRQVAAYVWAVSHGQAKP